MKAVHPIVSLCLHLEASPSGYYAWQKRHDCPGPRAAQDQALAQEIDQIHTRSRKTYGSPRVLEELRKKGRHHGRNRIARLMKQKGLIGRQKRRYRAGLIASMSRRGNCYDNAAMESFWSTLKLELVYRCCFDTRAQARREIFDYIETFYNRQRRHSALGYASPCAFENQPN
jgi:transposase InsO family protein